MSSPSSIIPGTKALCLMSASGQTRRFDLLTDTSGLPPTSDIAGPGQFANGPQADMRPLFDQLINAGEQQWRHGEA